MSKTVLARRHNSRGETVENADFSVTRAGEEIHVHIKGRGPGKSFTISLASWRELEAAAKEVGS